MKLTNRVPRKNSQFQGVQSMRTLRFVIPIVMLARMGVGLADEAAPADALTTEHVRAALARLNDPDFHQRESAVDDLFALGLGAIFPLREAAINGSPEVSVRAFDVLQRLYRGKDEPTFDAVEKTFEMLARVDNLSVSARAERAFESGSETRQLRAISQFEKLGGIFNFAERNPERQPLGRLKVENIMVGRDWAGEDAGLQLLTRIDDLRNSRFQLYIVRGAKVSREATFKLAASLPFMEITERGPARLGIRSKDISGQGCMINDVDEGSAADVAGLRANDQVIEIDGHSIDSFDGLIQIIKEKEPGDRVRIVFRRGFETQEAVAELTAWQPPKSAKSKR